MIPGMPELRMSCDHHVFNVDLSDAEQLTRAEIEGRRRIRALMDLIRAYGPPGSAIHLADVAATIGARETRRITGRYQLTGDDVLHGRRFEDAIANGTYPVDIHPAQPDKESYDRFYKEISTLRLGQGESYGIPYRILTPAGLHNVLVAGRCVSTDRSMQASIRVMPGCYITGQAAGVAAAMAAQAGTDIRGINARELQARLQAMGAWLPYCGT